MHVQDCDISHLRWKSIKETCPVQCSLNFSSQRGREVPIAPTMHHYKSANAISIIGKKKLGVCVSFDW